MKKNFESKKKLSSHFYTKLASCIYSSSFPIRLKPLSLYNDDPAKHMRNSCSKCGFSHKIVYAERLRCMYYTLCNRVCELNSHTFYQIVFIFFCCCCICFKLFKCAILSLNTPNQWTVPSGLTYRFHNPTGSPV